MSTDPRRLGPAESSRARGARLRPVLQVVLSLGPGGTERLVIEIAKRLHPAFPMAVCCLDEPGGWAHELTERGIRVEGLRRRPGFRPGLGVAIARAAARHGARVIHCHHYSPFVYGQVAARWRLGLRVVFTEHGRLSDDPPSWKRRLANAVLGRLPSRVFAVSADLRAHMIAEGFPARRVAVLHNGIDLGPRPGAAERALARSRLGLAPDRLVVGTIARLDPVKDLGALLSGFAILARSSPHATLVVIGGGPERAALEEAGRAAGAALDIRWLGHRDDARALLPALDLYANTSTHEGVSLTILEAMAAGLPVIATRVGGTPEVVVDGETGALVPARSPDAVGNALADLAAAPARRATMGSAGRRRVEERFTLDRMVERYARAYLGQETA